MRSGEQWGGYYSIYTSDASSLEICLNRENLPFISLNESEIVYNDISCMDTVDLKDLPERFSPLDPRLDPYMKSIAQLFTAYDEDTVYDILYVEKKSISPYLLYSKLFVEFYDSQISWSIGGFKPLQLFFPLVIFFFIFAGFLVTTPHNRWKTAIALAGWIPYVYLYGIPALILAVAFSFGVMRRVSSFFQAGLVFLTLIFAYYSSILNMEYIQHFLVGIISILYLTRSDKNRMVRRSQIVSSRKWKEKKIILKKSDHQLFSPIQIGASTMHTVGAAENKNNSLRYMTLFAMILICGLTLVNTSPDAYIVPLPENNPDLTGSSERGDVILSSSDYFTHIAFQEGFLYRSEWIYPRKENPVVYPVYSFDGKVALKSYEMIADYSENWFYDRIELLKSNNPAKILFSTVSPCFVIKKLNHEDSHGFLLLQFSFSVLILLLIIFSNGKKYTNMSVKFRNKLLRRNEQVA